MDKKIKSLLKDILIFAAGNASSKIVLLFLMPLYTTALTTAEYGVSDTLNTVVELLVPLFTICMSEAVFRFSVGNDEKQKGAVFLCSTKILIVGLGLGALVAIVARSVFSYKYAEFLFLMVVAFALKQFLGCYLRGIGKSMKFAVCGLLGTLALVGCNIIFLKVFQWGIDGYLWSVIISNMLSFILMACLCNPIKIIKQSWVSYKENKKTIFRELTRYSVPIVPNSISWWLNTAANKYILMFFCGAGVTGIFSAAGKLPAVINLLSSIFQQAWQYSSATEYNKTDTNSFYSKVFGLYSPCILVACSLIILINPLLSNILLQGEFFVASKYVPLLLFSAVLACYSVFFGGIYTASKESKMLMFTTVIGAVINIGVCFALIPFLQIYGALIAGILANFTVVIIRIIHSRKYVAITAKWWLIAISVALVFLQSVLGVLRNTYAYIASAIIMCIVIGLSILALKIKKESIGENIE